MEGALTSKTLLSAQIFWYFLSTTMMLSRFSVPFNCFVLESWGLCPEFRASTVVIAREPVGSLDGFLPSYRMF
jgi:hypothetical protein